ALGLRELFRPRRPCFAEGEHRADFERAFDVSEIRGSPVPTEGLVRIARDPAADGVERSEAIGAFRASAFGAAPLEIGGTRRIFGLAVTIARQLPEREERARVAGLHGVFEGPTCHGVVPDASLAEADVVRRQHWSVVTRLRVGR